MATAKAREEKVRATVVNPVARDRLYSIIERTMIPQTVEQVLAGALQGKLQEQSLLFLAMIDTWPRLQKALNEVSREAAKAPYAVTPFAARGKEATPQAIERAEFVDDCLLGMKPDPVRQERDWCGTIEYLAQGYCTGHVVAEILWTTANTPKAIKPVEARYYAYPRHGNDADRLMLNRTGHYNGALEDFPAYRFLIGIRAGHHGHPSVAAPLRSLVGWWMAANFGLKWMMQFAQVYGVPLRWATYPAGDDCALEAVASMLENVGSAGWGAFPAGTQMEIKESTKGAGDLPQRTLIEMADRQADIAILGQSLTTDVGDSGSRALGDVHQGVRQDVIEAVAKWVASILTHQLVPPIVALNGYPDDGEMPAVTVEWPEKEDEKAKAERDEILIGKLRIPVAKQWLYERHGIPMPEAGEDLFEPAAAERAPGAEEEPEDEDEDEPDESEVAAGHVAARGERALDRPIVDELTDNVLEMVSGTAPQFLAGVRPFFRQLVQLALAGETSDADFVRALERASLQIPELFGLLNVDALEDALNRAIGTAMLAGVGGRIVSSERIR